MASFGFSTTQEAESNGGIGTPVLLQGSSHIVSIVVTAEKGIFPTACHASPNPSIYWIVDSDAFDHMSGDNNLFSTWYHYTQNYKVRIADGSLSDVARIGEVILSDSDTNSSVTIIGNARVKNGLYRIDVDKKVISNKQSFTTGIFDTDTNDGDIMKLHYRYQLSSRVAAKQVGNCLV
ncbi:Retrovirus-related Pol polyprotein from transposon TNT 1-94 [Senna tora]|uniref:Retrovirus-related Pol polyprotein from transposon TNT 1-94 n=1 Tax=Senna tora TaxID=362788 RepID=A0A834SYQ1_9FABA|nr:Retrovirus-related Pol polyprotein from transposon TNT 1-94 [Senna tora]